MDSTTPWPHPKWVFACLGLAQRNNPVKSAIESLPFEEEEIKSQRAYLCFEIHCSGRPDSGLT